MIGIVPRAGTMESRIGRPLLQKRRWVCPECYHIRQQRRVSSINPDDAPQESRRVLSQTWTKPSIRKRNTRLNVERDTLVKQQRQPDTDDWADTFVNPDDYWGPFDETDTRPISINRSFAPIDYRIEIPRALLQNDETQLFRALHCARNDDEYMQSLPATTFAQILQKLNQSSIIKDAKFYLGRLGSKKAHYLQLRSTREVLTDYRRLITRITEQWTMGKNKLSLAHYGEIFDAAATLGNRRFATLIHRLMLRRGAVPDLRCYNAILSTTIWNNVYGVYRPDTEMVTAKYMAMRSGKTNFRKLFGHQKQWGAKYRFSNWKVGEHGIQREVDKILKLMNKNQATPDQRTWALVILGSAREGDMASVKKVLMDVWNIDTDNVGVVNQDITVTNYPKHSPLYPTSQLLTDIVYAFCINNDVGTGMKLVNHISSAYDIPIANETWECLFAWTVIFSQNKYGKANLKWGMRRSLPTDTPSRLWDLMTSPPYNFEPTIDTANMFLSALYRLERPLWELEKHILSAVKLYYIARTAEDDTLKELKEAGEQHQKGLVPLSHVHRLQRRAYYNNLNKRHHNQIIRRWTNMFLTRNLPQDRWYLLNGAPQFLRAMEHHMTRSVAYQLVSGKVEFELERYNVQKLQLSSVMDFVSLGFSNNINPATLQREDIWAV